MRLKFLVFAILLFEYTLISPYLEKYSEQVEMPMAVISGLLVLAAGTIIVMSRRSRPIALRSFLHGLLAIGLLNALYGGGRYFEAKSRLQSELWQKENAMRAFAESLKSPSGRRWDRSHEWADRIDRCCEEIARQERRLERSQEIAVVGGLVALFAIGTAVASSRSLVNPNDCYPKRESRDAILVLQKGERS